MCFVLRAGSGSGRILAACSGPLLLPLPGYCPPQTPGLAVVLVGERKDSQTYVRNKKKACEEVRPKNRRGCRVVQGQDVPLQQQQLLLLVVVACRHWLVAVRCAAVD